MGCGKEVSPNMSKTPGWKITNADEFEKDTRGFNKMLLRRNHNKLLQTSLYCLQTWHANCDISFLLYETNPRCPNAKEIATITDNAIGYACKGNATLTIEKRTSKRFCIKVNKYNDTIIFIYIYTHYTIYIYIAVKQRLVMKKVLSKQFKNVLTNLLQIELSENKKHFVR